MRLRAAAAVTTPALRQQSATGRVAAHAILAVAVAQQHAIHATTNGDHCNAAVPARHVAVRRAMEPMRLAVDRPAADAVRTADAQAPMLRPRSIPDVAAQIRHQFLPVADVAAATVATLNPQRFMVAVADLAALIQHPFQTAADVVATWVDTPSLLPCTAAVAVAAADVVGRWFTDTADK